MYHLLNIILIICTLIFHSNVYGMDAAIEEKKESSAYYIACKSFCTEHVKFERIASAQQEIECYQAIYTESKGRNCWFTGLEPMPLFCRNLLDDNAISTIKKDYTPGPIFTTDHDLIQKKDIEYFQKKEQSGFYKFPMSFADYSIYDKQTQKFVGRFIFKNFVKDGKIEYGIYVFEKFRKSGLGVEITSGIFKNLIDPAIGKSFAISFYLECDELNSQQRSFKTEIHNNFQGVFGTISPWYNYPSVSISHKAGCALRWKAHIPITFYPIGNKSSMNQYDIGCFKDVIKTLFTLNKFWMGSEIKAEASVIPPEKFFSFLKLLEEESNEEDSLMENLYSLLRTQDYDTFISTIEALTFMGESKEDLKEGLDPRDVKNLLSRNKSFLFVKHKGLLEYLSRDKVISENTGEESSESNFENSEEDMGQVSKKRTLSASDIEENGSRPTKRRK